MGESTCLVRSFSSPTETSCVPQEGNPIRALGESISFGRFMSESLAWEKWSTFSHNRYVEEAEKYSRPGSVAEKKAYFEAHYKRKAAEKAAALLQEANVSANATFDSETQQGNCTHSSIQIKSNADDNMTSSEQPDKDAVNYQVVDHADTNNYKCDKELIDLNISKVKGVQHVPHPHVDTNPNVGNSILVDNSNQFDNVKVNETVVATTDVGTVGLEVLASPVKGREVRSSPKLSTKTRAAKISHSLDRRKADAAVQSRNGTSSGSKGRKSVGDSVVKKRLTAWSLNMSISLPSGAGETSKTVAAAAQSRNGINCGSKGKSVLDLVEKKRLTARSLHMSANLPSGSGETSKIAAPAVQPGNVISNASKRLKSVEYSVEKRPTARPLYMSVNLPSGAGEKCKTTSVFEYNKIKKINSNLPNVSKDHPVASQTSTEVSSGLLNQASANLEGRSCPRSSITAKSNPQSPTIPSPFRFRSEERAVKRKEHLQRMDETRSKEAEKVRPQSRFKEKIQHDYNKLRQSCGSQSPSNQMRKISLTQPWSPKLGRNGSSSTGQDKNLGNSWKPPISNNDTKRVTEKINRTARQSVTSLSKITRENASPNIQR